MVYHGFMHIIIFKFFFKKKKHQRPMNPKRKKGKKKKWQASHIYFGQLKLYKKKVKRKCRQFCSNIFVYFSLLFSLKFGEIVFWRGRRQNLQAPPKSLIFSTLNQTTKNIIFSPSFSIISKITLTKYNLRVSLDTAYFVEN